MQIKDSVDLVDNQVAETPFEKNVVRKLRKIIMGVGGWCGGRGTSGSSRIYMTPGTNE
jgi:hypothetical protein